MILIMQYELAQPDKKTSIAIGNRGFIISETDIFIRPSSNLRGKFFLQTDSLRRNW